MKPNKQTALAFLDKYRDKTLSFGCKIYRTGACREFFISKVGSEMCFVKENKHGKWMPFTVPEPHGSQKFKILGHRATPLDLLRALEDAYRHSHVAITGTGEMIFDRVNSSNGRGWVYLPEEKNSERITIPITTRHLADLDENDPLWESLVAIFNLD